MKKTVTKLEKEKYSGLYNFDALIPEKIVYHLDGKEFKNMVQQIHEETECHISPFKDHDAKEFSFNFSALSINLQNDTIHTVNESNYRYESQPYVDEEKIDDATIQSLIGINGFTIRDAKQIKKIKRQLKKPFDASDLKCLEKQCKLLEKSESYEKKIHEALMQIGKNQFISIEEDTSEWTFEQYIDYIVQKENLSLLDILSIDITFVDRKKKETFTMIREEPEKYELFERQVLSKMIL